MKVSINSTAAFQPSPVNWRFPFYTLMLDRFINGDPSNDDANGTAWEHDLSTYGSSSELILQEDD